MKDCLLYFVKYPTPGKVKTRLAEATSPQWAADFYRTFAQDKLAELTDGLDADILIFFTPAEKGNGMKGWLGPDRTYLPQQGADLGERMSNALRKAFTMGYGRAVLTGSDIPDLTPALVREALDSLTPDTVCLGPAEDGGYYLIGFHRDGFVPGIFPDMQWSTPDVCGTTTARITAAGKSCAQLPRLRDVDTIEDLETLGPDAANHPLEFHPKK